MVCIDVHTIIHRVLQQLRRAQLELASVIFQDELSSSQICCLSSHLVDSIITMQHSLTVCRSPRASLLELLLSLLPPTNGYAHGHTHSHDDGHGLSNGFHAEGARAVQNGKGQGSAGEKEAFRKRVCLSARIYILLICVQCILVKVGKDAGQA